MAFTPSGWIPSLGPLAGSQVPERSWRGAAAGATFWLLAAPDLSSVFRSLAAGACCARLLATRATDGKISATTTTMIRIFVIRGLPSTRDISTGNLLLAAALARLLKLLEKPRRALAVHC